MVPKGSVFELTIGHFEQRGPFVFFWSDFEGVLPTLGNFDFPPYPVDP